MKRWLALATCLLIDGATAHYAMAQRTAPRAHVVTAGGAVGYLGVGVAEIDDERAKALNLKEDHGVVVMSVGDETPAAKAGLRSSDVIVEFNGQRVEGVDQFMRMVRETPPNRKVTLKIERGGTPQTLSATLTAHTRPSIGNFEFEMPEMPEMPEVPLAPTAPRVYLPDTPRPLLSWQQGAIGIEAEPVSGQLAEYFGVKEGVLVRAVNRNSAAEKAGMKAGDVVVRVASTTVRTPQEMSREVRASRGNQAPVQVAVVRNHREMSLALKLSDQE